MTDLQPGAILEVARRAGLEPQRVGRDEYAVRCFRPENHRNGDADPSCRLNAPRNTYFCDVCNQGGGLVEFARSWGVDLRSVLPNAHSRVKATVKKKAKKPVHFESVGPISATTQAEFVDRLGKRYSAEAWRKVGVHEGRVGSEPAIGFPLLSGGWKVCLHRRPDIKRNKPYTFLHSNGGKMDLLLVGDGDEVVLTAGEWDLLAALTAGVRCAATSTGGEGSWCPEFTERLRGKRILISYDRDPAGDRGAEKVATELAAAGIEVFVVRLPLSGDPDGDGKDLSDYLAIQGPEGLTRLLDEAKVAGPYVAHDDKPECGAEKVLREINERLRFVPENAGPEHRERCLQGLLPSLAQLGPTAQDIAYREVKRSLKIGVQAIRSELAAYKVTAAKGSSKANTTQAKPSREALQLLKDAGLLDRFLEDTRKLGVVGEEANRIAVFLVMTSRLMERPLDLVVKGESSAGKNHLIETVAKCIPQHDLIRITALSPQALLYWDGDLKGKVLLVTEAEGAERAEYQLRVLQSEGCLIVHYVTKIDGQLRTVEHKVEGPAATITTTTRETLHPENETRLIEIALDESAEQTGRILQYQADLATQGDQISSIDEIGKLWTGVQAGLERLPVHIPFAKLIRFCPQRVRARRDFPKLLNLIRVSAFLHQHQREHQEVSGRTHIVSDIRDYALAYDLLHAFIERVNAGLNDRENRVLGELRRREGERLTARQMAGALGWHEEAGRKRAKRCLDRLHEKGHAGATDGKAGIATEYWFQNQPRPADEGISTPDEVAEAWSRQGGHLPTTWTTPLSRSK